MSKYYYKGLGPYYKMAPKRSYAATGGSYYIRSKQSKTSNGAYGSASNQAMRREMALKRRKTSPSAAVMNQQMRTLLQGKTRDAVDVQNTFAVEDDSIWNSCLTSTTQTATAATGTGVIVADTDTATVNYVHTKGSIRSESILVTPTDLGNAENVVNPRLRMIYVWFHNPKLQPGASGFLPPTTEVLVSPVNVDSHYVTETQNNGNHSILFDKTYTLQRNWIVSGGSTAGASIPTGTFIVNVDEVIKVNRKQHYHQSAGTVNGTTNGGHYDSTNKSGMISSGLFVRYMIVDAGDGIGTFNRVRLGGTMVDRLNYTA